MPSIFHKAPVVLLAILVAAVASPTRADFIFDVSLDTSSLVGRAAGQPYSIDFVLIDGSGNGDGNNTVTISQFGFGGGSASGSPALSGGARGSLTSPPVVITDTSFLNEFTQAFTPGGTLSFHVDLTTHLDSGLPPDSFEFAILDRSGGAIPTLDPSGADNLLTADINSASPAIIAYASDSTRTPPGGGGPIAIGRPVVDVASVPEPSSLALSLVALGSSALLAIRQKKKPALRAARNSVGGSP